jgi:hypothetical protein
MRKRKPTPPTFLAQPAIIKTMRLFSRRQGATVAQVQAALGGWASPSVRGMISRLGAAGIELERTWRDGRLIYHYGKRFTGPRMR